MPSFDGAGALRWTVRVSPHPQHPGQLEVNRTRTDDPSGRGAVMMRLNRNDAMVLAQYLLDVARELPMAPDDEVVTETENGGPDDE